MNWRTEWYFKPLKELMDKVLLNGEISDGFHPIQPSPYERGTGEDQDVENPYMRPIIAPLKLDGAVSRAMMRSIREKGSEKSLSQLKTAMQTLIPQLFDWEDKEMESGAVDDVCGSTQCFKNISVATE